LVLAIVIIVFSSAILVQCVECKVVVSFVATIWGLGGPEEDHQLHHCCWTGRVSERDEEEDL